MAEMLSSAVQFTEEDPSIRTIPNLASCVLAIQGVAERGPIATPTLVTSFEEFLRIFGGFINGYHLAMAVRMFFMNGGRYAYVTRTCHYTNVAVKSSATAAVGSVTLQTGATAASGASVTGTVIGPWALSPGDTLIGDVEGIGNQTATFTATAAAVECATAETYNLTNGMTLEVKVDDESVAQVVTFNTADFANIAAATAEEVAAVINEDLAGARATATTTKTKVTITSDTKGTGSKIEVTGGTANAILNFSLVAVAGTGNVVDISAVTFSEVETIVEAAWTNGSGVDVTSVTGKVKITTVATGAAATLEVDASSTADTIFGIDNLAHAGADGATQNTLDVDGSSPGAYANLLKARVTDASSGVAEEFNFYVVRGSTVLEVFTNLTMDSAGERYAPDFVNHTDYGSIYVTLEDKAATGTAEQRRPANTSGSSLSGGSDGLSGLDYNDFIGSQAGGTGYYAFDGNEDISILVDPDGSSVASGVTSVHAAMINYCEAVRENKVVALLDPPASKSRTEIVAHRDLLGQHEIAALYWPRVEVMNPDKTIYGATTVGVSVPPAALVAGVASRNDYSQTDGVFHQPAGVEDGLLVGVVGLEGETGSTGVPHAVRKKPTRDVVFPKRVNPITYLRGFGFFIDGARTLKGTGNFPSVGERRGVSHVERELDVGLQWVRHKNNTPELREDVDTTVDAYLHGWMDRGAFAAKDPSKAYFVDVSDALNPPSLVRAGKLALRVGMATNAPAEFVEVKVTKDTRALEEELFGSV